MDTSSNIVLEKLKAFCVYRERCHQEVRSKLLAEKIYGEELEEIMSILIQENFLNEERFAMAYAVGKFRQNKWGKTKIKMEFLRLNVSTYCINKGMEAIDEEEYEETIENLWNKKYETLRDSKEFVKKQKTLNYLLSKGFEYELIKNLM